MDDSQSVDLEEYKQLRAEIINRQTLSNQLVLGMITALGAGVGLAVSKSYPDALIGLAVLASCFWLLWIDHSAQVFKIAYYIHVRLGPHLQSGGTNILGWEQFVRKLDSGKLPGREHLLTGAIHPTSAARMYAEIFLGGGAVVLLAIFLIIPHSWHGIEIAGVLCTEALIIYSIWQAFDMNDMIREINEAIVDR